MCKNDQINIRNTKPLSLSLYPTTCSLSLFLMFNVYESLIVTCMLEIRIEGLDAQKQTVCGFFVDVKRETAFKQEEKAPTRCEEM